MNAVKQFYKGHPVWSWVILVFVGLTLLGALVPAGEEGSDEPTQEAAQEQPKQEAEAESKIKLTASAPLQTTSDWAVVKGSVDPATARVSVVTGHLGKWRKSIDVDAQGRFRSRVKFDGYVIHVTAKAEGYRTAKEEFYTRRVLSAAEKQERREAREAREAQRRAEEQARREQERAERAHANALASAQDYLDLGGFSRQGLIEQLEFEGYSNADATYAADNVGADWNAEAVESAEDYLDTTSFSQQGLIEQLTFEGFTPEQAQYAVAKVY